MGYEQVELKILARVSRHNSEQDKADDEAWQRFQKEVAILIENDPDLERIIVAY